MEIVVFFSVAFGTPIRGANGDGGQTVADHIQLFPLRDDVRWCSVVHRHMPPSQLLTGPADPLVRVPRPALGLRAEVD
jgi:hypothetical protein